MSVEDKDLPRQTWEALRKAAGLPTVPMESEILALAVIIDPSAYAGEYGSDTPYLRDEQFAKRRIARDKANLLIRGGWRPTQSWP